MTHNVCWGAIEDGESRLNERRKSDVREDRWTVLADCAAIPTAE
jgi:hypothetical protein